MTAQMMGLYSKSDLEDSSDTIKTVILAALVKEELLEYSVADEWAQTHTILFRKKTLFRTFTNIWDKEPEAKGYFLKVVKLV